MGVSEPSRRTERALFSTFSVLAFLGLLYGLKYALRPRSIVGFLLMPALCACVIYENVILAVGDLDNGGAAVGIGRAAHAAIVPLFLIATFELTYLIHKRRSVNFCAIAFDASHRNKKKDGGICSTVLRFSIWIVAAVLFGLGLMVNYEIVESSSFEAGSQGYYNMSGDWDAHFWLSLVPSLVLWVFVAYFGVQLWNYGTHYSFMVHASWFNPWIWLVVGATALCAGHICPKEIYAITTNAGELALLLCLERMFPEIVDELEQQDRMSEFISESEQEKQKHAQMVPIRIDNIEATVSVSGA